MLYLACQKTGKRALNSEMNALGNNYPRRRYSRCVDRVISCIIYVTLPVCVRACVCVPVCIRALKENSLSYQHQTW